MHRSFDPADCPAAEPEQTVSRGRWEAAVRAQHDTARAFARTVADAITARVPDAAYLVFENDDDLDGYLDDDLFLDSIRGSDGRVLVDFGDAASEALLAGITDVVGGTAGREAWALLTAMRELRMAGGVFDMLPYDLVDGDRDEEWGAYCLIVAPSGFPEDWDWDDPATDVGRRLLRPYCAPRPPQPA
ncbi:hypothetical protein ACWDBD_19505 [Streptomyces sp. NPDC001118]|uniref:hypothetical protein n=1 Tax=Streptomyces sp. NPDC001795 TaxID=3154525 RepID=UPI00332187AF